MTIIVYNDHNNIVENDSHCMHAYITILWTMYYKFAIRCLCKVNKLFLSCMKLFDCDGTNYQLGVHRFHIQYRLKHKSLHANRKGGRVVPLNSDSDKPGVTPTELIQLGRLGLSYKQIGKKLGVDPHKEEVLQVYHSIEQATGVDVEDVKGPSKVSPNNPLWYIQIR